MFPRTIKNVNTWYFHTKTSTPIDCLSTYFYRSLVRKTVCFGLYIDKTCVPDVFSESPLNTDTRIIRTLWHVSFGVRINRVPLYSAHLLIPPSTQAKFLDLPLISVASHTDVIFVPRVSHDGLRKKRLLIVSSLPTSQKNVCVVGYHASV